MSPAIVRQLPLPRGVADQARGFVSTLDERIVALDLDSGRPAWSRALPGSPWIAGGDELFVASPLGNGVSLSVLSVMGQGSPIRSSSLPAPAILAEAAGDFDLDVRLADGALEVAWRISSRYRGGAPPADFVRAREDRETTGSLRYDLASGMAVSGPARDFPRIRSWPYRRRGAWRETGWSARGETLTLGYDGSSLSLRRKDGRSVALGEGEGFEPVVTPCGEFLFLRRTVPAGRPWQVFALPAAEPVGELSWPAGAQLPTVVGERAYCLRSSVLLASDLASGRTAWTFELGPAGGPPPPAPPA